MIKRYICYVTVCFALGLYTVLYESYELMILFWFVLFLPVAMLGILILVKKNIKISHNIPKNRVKVGEDIPIVINIENKTIIPVVLLEIQIDCINELYKTTKSEKLEIPTLKTGKQVFSFGIKSKYCGNVKICIKQVKIIDYFYLFKLSQNINIEKTVPVMPNTVMLECDSVMTNTAMLIDSDVFSKTQKGSDPSEVFEFREYRQGDELHCINWKLSAKSDNYIVKEMSLPISNGLVILMELFIPNSIKNIYAYVDAIIGIVIGISLKLQELEYVHYIAWYDEKSSKCRKIQVKNDTSLEEVLQNIFMSSIYNDEMKLLREYDIEFEDDIETHMYYVGMSYDEKTLEIYTSRRENVLKNYVLVVDDVVEENVYDEFEANNVILQSVALNNLENSVTALVL